MFQRAQRKKAKLRLAILGPSGAGKTYSAILIAMGLGGKIAMIDSERGSGELYAHLTVYDVCQIAPPYTPQKYIEAIHGAERAGYSTIIIDSLTHAWAGSGGLLEEVDKRKGKGNDFTAWRDITPQHNALVDAMLQSSCHIIGTMRTKTAYDMVKDERTGKIKPQKVGLAPIQRDGLEYEFTVVLDVDLDRHLATASKDRTSLFDGKTFTPGVETGKELVSWLESGVDAPATNGQSQRGDTPSPALRSMDQMPRLDRYDIEAVRAEFGACATIDELTTALKGLAIPDGHPQREPIGVMFKERRNTIDFAGPLSANKPPQEEPRGEPVTPAQVKAIQAHYSAMGVEREERLADLSAFAKREITSTKELTKAEATTIIDHFNRANPRAA